MDWGVCHITSLRTKGEGHITEDAMDWGVCHITEDAMDWGVCHITEDAMDWGVCHITSLRTLWTEVCATLLRALWTEVCLGVRHLPGPLSTPPVISIPFFARPSNGPTCRLAAHRNLLKAASCPARHL